MNTPQLRITILVDNHAGCGLIEEHGLSLWIETEGRRIVFDTGQGGALASNAKALGVNLAQADMLVLSHGHYDHTGAVPLVLRHRDDIRVYCHPATVQPRYSIRNEMPKPIAMPEQSKAALDHLHAHNLQWVSRPLRLSEKMGITGSIPRQTAYEDTGGPFFLDRKGTRPDPIVDDLALWIQTDQGVVVCVGCCHAGLVNTLRQVQQLAAEPRIRAVIGGFHLLNASGQRLDHTVAALESLKPAMLVPCHCTGEAATQLLCERLGSSVSPGRAGMVLSF